MTRVDEIYDDLELIIAEHKAFRRVVDENTKLKSAFEDIRAELEKELITHGQVVDGEYFAEDFEKKLHMDDTDEYEINTESIDMAIKALERSRWIPVSEALPEKNQRVIVCYETMEGLKVDISMFDKYGCLIGKAVAWMPLPEPYRAESEVQDADSN